MKYSTSQLQSISGDLSNIENILEQRDILKETLKDTTLMILDNIKKNRELIKEWEEVFLEHENKIGKLAKELIDQAERINLLQKAVSRIINNKVNK